jgi:hypothetical protein
MPPVTCHLVKFAAAPILVELQQMAFVNSPCFFPVPSASLSQKTGEEVAMISKIQCSVLCSNVFELKVEGTGTKNLAPVLG